MKDYELPNNYIYLYHTDEYFILPVFPEHVSDNLKSTFAEQNSLSRTAPMFSYSNSGPRDINVQFTLHRDLMESFNKNGKGRIKLNGSGSNDIITDISDDYVDLLIKKLQSIALPRYSKSQRSVVAPQVAIRIGDDIFIKGIVNGGVSVEYDLPIMDNNKYAFVKINFTVYETQPYDADSVGQLGSFRGMTQKFADMMGGRK